MVGPPGCGKTILAQQLPKILPPLSQSEALELTRLQSIAGKLGSVTNLVRQRPFRAPHPSTSAAGLLGGGKNPRPGELSLAHGGVLFLDELTEFPRSLLDQLRQPLEEGCSGSAEPTCAAPSHVMSPLLQQPIRVLADGMVIAQTAVDVRSFNASATGAAYLGHF